MVLVWLATRQPKNKEDLGPRTSEIAESLAATLALERGAARAALAPCLRSLVTQDLVQSTTPAGKKAPRWLLSKAGRERALEVLGMPALPERQRIDWTWAKKVLVLGALGQPQSPALEKSGQSEWLAAWTLARHHRLTCAGNATPARVLRELAARVAGSTAVDRFTLADAFSLLVVRPLEKAPAVFSLRDFARRVNEAARAAPTGRWLDDRVFISHVWSETERRGDFPEMTFAQFQAHLVAAHKAQLLRLTRGDLIAALPKEDVRGSETDDGDSTFHFVRIDRVQLEGARQ